MKKVALVTGASSGIGEQVALQLADQGYQVVGGARHIAESKAFTARGITTHQLDVTAHESVVAFVADTVKQYGRVDVVVNSAGYGSFGALEEVPLAEARRQLDVNVLGAMDLVQQVTPYMRQQHSGKVINISSMAGQTYGVLGGWYFVSKHALETMSDVLRLELAPAGIDVVIVEPGVTATNWASVTNQKMAAATPDDSPYQALAAKQAAMITHASQTAAQVAQVVCKAIAARKPKTRYAVRWQEGVMMTLWRLASYKRQDKLALRLAK
ncbi:MAG: SDR family NAD(P)-dependent oxidoreductase [Lactobacillus sp.]|jgi:NAD(P)-dependent dehydrogenase (short-subunit alcohol dehydrogenase family)|nr:SDR family NAD(P)-dependent oxidoreductase [Lactobacillus sp.]MCI2033397.1 SDR family NAD(P)-dependent oxidoreductase [Lactobacillus sp.]